ncbi:MAG: molybdate transport system ATP-binding protein [Paraburkholderia sp.]|nr:molybdate transport system ATP-binding protein [Paraburkholderia sp.]
MRRELSDLQTRLDIPMVLITHDPDDVAALGDQVVQVSDDCVRENQAFTGVCAQRALRPPFAVRVSRTSAPQSFTPRITLDALNAATAVPPSASPSVSTLSFVTTAVITAPPSSTNDTSALTAPCFKLSTLPRN